MNSTSRFVFRCLGAAFALIVGRVALPAQTAVFSSQVAFNAASTGLTTESFASIGALYPATTGLIGPFDSNASSHGYYPANTFGPGLQVNAIGGDDNYLVVVHPDSGLWTFNPPGSIPTTAVSTNQNLNGVLMQFVFTTGVTTAAGFNYWNPGTDGTLATVIKAYDTGNALLSSSTLTPSQGGAFYGITSSIPIGSITMQSYWYSVGSENVEVANNVSFGTATAIPEPSTYAAIAGAAILGLAIWRRRNSAMRASAAIQNPPLTA